MRVAVILTLAAVVAAGAQPAAAAGGGRVALLPVVVEHATLDEAPVYERLDAVMQKAVAAAAPNVQDVDAMRAALDDARAAGVDCDRKDRVCLGKLAVLDDVQRLLVVHAHRGGTVFVVAILAVAGDGSAAEVQALLPLGPEEVQRQAAHDLVVRALELPLGKAAPASARGSAAGDPSGDGGARRATSSGGPSSSATTSTTPRVPIAGATLLALGAGAGAAGLTGALVLDALLAKPEPFADRAGKLFFGQAAAVTALAGVVVAGGGAALCVLGE